jgi:hypothetical protein
MEKKEVARKKSDQSKTGSSTVWSDEIGNWRLTQNNSNHVCRSERLADGKIFL